MESLDSLHDLSHESWYGQIHETFDLTDNDILQSVSNASSFFNLEIPAIIGEGDATGVLTQMSSTAEDDVLMFSRQELQEMGIADKEGFDLVMTHECAHRALQDGSYNFNSHQEELCCDYLAGVRAGLNGLEHGKMESSLANDQESESHPDGLRRVAAIEEGVAFANSYMDMHNNVPPSFEECMQHFEHSEICKNAADQINLRKDDNDVDEDDLKEIYKKTEGKERDFNQEEMKKYKVCASRHGCSGATNCDYSYGNYPG